jgi:hypothetical protein
MTISSIVTYSMYQRDNVKLEKNFQATPEIKREVDYFKSAVGKLKSVDDVFKDPRLLDFMSKSLNLGSDAQYPGKMRRILTQSVDDKDAIMNKLSDKRYRQAADVLNFGDTGLSHLQMASTQDDMIKKYTDNQYESSIGSDNEAVRKARYFDKYANTVNNVWDVLADPILRDVVTKTLSLPANIAVQPIETQGEAVTSRLDVSKFKDQSFRDSFVKRYLTKTDLESADTSNDWRVNLFGAASGGGSAGSAGLVNLFA